MLATCALVTCALVVWAVSCRSSSSADRSLEAGASPLVAEFAASYSKDAPPSSVVRTFDIVAAETEATLVDGTRMRVWAYNGTVPGPTLRVRLGETLRVRFTNHLPQPTTIHWHGVRVPNAMDGVPGATQPPVAPGETFVYEFTPKDAGTFWFHPHLRSSEQVERGLYGVLIVEDAEPRPYSRDVVWVLDDWLRDERGQIVEQFNTPHDLMHDGRWGNAITVNSSTSEALVVASGERIRLRLLNSANGRVFKPDFSGLDAKVIAVDGMYLREPIAPNDLEIAPGNRVDLDVTFAATESKRIPVVDRFYAARPNHLADIVIDGVAPQPTAAFDSPAHAHVPFWRSALDTPVDHEFRLDARRGGPLGIEWTIDGHAFSDHDHEQHHAAVTFPQRSFRHLRFTNDSFRIHPIHLHGMFFKLLARNGVPIDEPFFRDTVLVHSKESIDIGLVPLDVGRWMMHCHILEHAEAGMMTFIDVVAGCSG